MIIFHEGLPGSGKSYEAAVNQIIPSLLKGRKVYAYIEGINRIKFSQITGLDIETVIDLLKPLTKEQVKDVQIHVPNDCLVIIDELQDFFPAGKNTLSPGITEFVTQHRHRGIDIVCMGQDHRDCHMLWKRRIDTLISFTKRDAIGSPGSYTWNTFKLKAGKFEKLRSGKGVYDPKYFGLYASHSDGVTAIDSHKDDRTNIFKASSFRFWLPAFSVVLIVAVYFVYNLFYSGISQPNPGTVTTKVTVKSIDPPKTLPSAPVQPVIEKLKKPQDQAIEDYEFVETYLKQYRLRLSGFAQSVSDKNKVVVKIDFYEGDRIKESFGTKDFKEFGYAVTIKPYGVLISKNDKKYPVTRWPLDNRQNVTERDRPLMRSPDYPSDETGSVQGT